MKKEGTNEGNGGGNPPPIKPVYIEFLRRSPYPSGTNRVGNFQFYWRRLSLPLPSFLCLALPILLAIFEVSEIFGAAVRPSHWPVGRPARQTTGSACSVCLGEEGEAAAAAAAVFI